MQSLAELNDYFAELCWDSAYKQPTPAQVESGVQVPEISERQVWTCLQHLEETATGPYLIPVLGVERPRGNFCIFNSQDLELVPEV